MRSVKGGTLKLAITREVSAVDEGASAEALQDIAEAATEQKLDDLARALRTKGAQSAFVAAVGDLSPFLRDSLRRRPEILNGLLEVSVGDRLTMINADIAALAAATDAGEANLMRDLRNLKLEAHSLIALSDLCGDSDAPETVARLSDLAAACVSSAAGFLLLDAHRTGKLVLPDPEHPAKQSGWILLAMGKLGAGELNFSSDIDIISFFEPDAAAITDPYEANELFARLTRRLVRILNDRTEHGYVFRTDLRLRPDPGSTPLAIPVHAALNYYESRGQNWERAAMIKARPIAGDIEAGTAFLSELRPYVWRKYLDYAAIADIHSIKRQIHAHKGHGEIAVKAHNVKLGRGGIREIEFFVQTQQLIAGGRFPELRGRETVAMLKQLASRKWITEETAAALTEDYWFLRRVENALQIRDDEQTHLLPEDDAGLEIVARMLGFADASAFSTKFTAALKDVERHYSALFESAPELSGNVGNLVFTGDVDDPDTLETLQRIGFTRPSDIARIIRTWHFGRYRATQSAEARERLTELTPALLEAFGNTKRADEALVRFDAFLSGLPAGIQLFALLQTNPGLLRLIATIMSAAPRLAEIITRRAHVFDGLLDPSLLAELPERAYLDQRLQSFLAGSQIYEEVLDRLRIFAAEQKFLIGVRLLAGAIDATRAGLAFSDLADLCLDAALGAVLKEFRTRHGDLPGGRVVLVAMGKLGSRELTAGSDVDLILLYDHDAGADYSDGEKPLATSHYYARLTQRLIAAISAPTAEGVLYELDLRLRPSGNKGPVATHIDAFRKYQREEAWTWEHMALTRARPFAGDPELIAESVDTIAEVLAFTRDGSKVVKDARDMRKLLEEEKPPKDVWDIKLHPGGLIDLEFIAQVATLNGRVTGARESRGTGDVLAHLAPDFADEQVKAELVAAFDFYATITQITRLCLTGPFEREDVPPGLVDLLLKATDLPDFKVLEAHLKDTLKRVRKHFSELLRP